MSGRLAASVHLLRPPTLDNLREHLAGHLHTYHVLHFDGHGSYREGAPVGVDDRGVPSGPTGNSCWKINTVTRRP
jgi:hypothetical protein